MHKVFLSWSGVMSHQVALVLKDWLPVVIQYLDPFVSSEDIGKGTHWGEMLAQELNDTDYGILCITPYNIGCPWLNFEAGALSKSIKRSLVLPFLFKVNLDAFHGPISQFQATIFDKEDVFELLSTINDHFSDEEKLKADLLRRQFEKWWPDLDAALNKIIDDPAKESQSGIHWLYTSENLANMAAEESVKSIWIITPDFFKHALSDRMKPVMEANIARGVTYKYIAPQSRFTDGVRNQLRNISDDVKKLDVRDIPDTDFRSLAVTDYVIINPDDELQHPLRVYLELPVNEEDHWILVEREAAVGFSERFTKMWNCNPASEPST
jgi:hypothetical protein